MTMKLFKFIAPLLLAAFAIAACKVVKPYRRPENVAAGALYRDTSITDSTFGQISTTAAPRILQVALHLRF